MNNVLVKSKLEFDANNKATLKFPVGAPIISGVVLNDDIYLSVVVDTEKKDMEERLFEIKVPGEPIDIETPNVFIASVVINNDIVSVFELLTQEKIERILQQRQMGQ